MRESSVILQHWWCRSYSGGWQSPSIRPCMSHWYCNWVTPGIRSCATKKLWQLDIDPRCHCATISERILPHERVILSSAFLFYFIFFPVPEFRPVDASSCTPTEESWRWTTVAEWNFRGFNAETSAFRSWVNVNVSKPRISAFPQLGHL
jgi:hypothetical protein